VENQSPAGERNNAMLPWYLRNWDAALFTGHIAEMFALKIRQGQLGDRVRLYVIPLETAQIATICAALREDTRVRFLEFITTEMCDRGAAHVANLIAAPTGLERIDLSDNHITAAGSAVIAAALSDRRRRQLPAIRVNLSGNPCVVENQENRLRRSHQEPPSRSLLPRF
jgi:hypothetical protein